ncbi:formylglycine-generating enzyme family protein [Chloroflexi bacterium TSY]|nr:formylglycine-generating enzyme family protein [Chloroflexi bacterium TSY]
MENLRRALDKGLDEWWTNGKLIAPGLLRNGLLALEAGHRLDEAHLSLLLRTSLRIRRGMITALRHQTDADRTAYLLKEVLTDLSEPLPLQTLWRLRQEDEQSAEWVSLLLDDLEMELATLPKNKSALAEMAIRQLRSDMPLQESIIVPQPRRHPASLPMPHWSISRFFIVLLVILFLGAFFVWNQQRTTLDEMVTINGGAYKLTRHVVSQIEDTSDGESGNANLPADVNRLIVMDTFAIDRTEVTNRSYQICYEKGVCAAPITDSSKTHSDYFTNPIFELYPVTNIRWEDAKTYCEWVGKRLPSEDEWQVAASFAPATDRQFHYPWGEQFNIQYANSAQSRIGDTVEVGTYYPNGNSPFGIADMAGNVAEWTATHVPDERRAGTDLVGPAYVVKGGAYNHDKELLRAGSYLDVQGNAALPWLGFRCSVSVLEEVESQ